VYEVKFSERADVFVNHTAKFGIEERYDWAISRLKKNNIKTVLDLGC
jgi:hypothetical protein